MAAAVQCTSAVCKSVFALSDISSRGRNSTTSLRHFSCAARFKFNPLVMLSSEHRASMDNSSVSRSEPRNMKMAAVQGSTEATESKVGNAASASPPLSVTYLEGNTWIWEILGLQILVDPVLVGNLDFGIPLLYDAAKKVVQDYKLEDLPELDYLLICQGYDDHCHEKTLEPLSKLKPNLRVIASPNAEPILSKYFKNVTYLEPKSGETTVLKAKNGAQVKIRASPGPVLGPPWQRPENGYFIEVEEPKFSIYYEPHCIFENANLEGQSADVVLTPVVKQVLPAYTLVSGQEDAVRVAEFLNPKFIVTMKNGDLDAKGLLSMIVRQEGSNESFQELLAKKLPNTQVLNPEVGKALKVPIAV